MNRIAIKCVRHDRLLLRVENPQARQCCMHAIFRKSGMIFIRQYY